MNCVSLVGRLTKDPEARKTINGNSSLQFTVAVDRGTKDQNGNRITDFINCQAWNKTADFICSYFRKGDPIEINGNLQTRTYEKDGQKVFVTEVYVTKADFVPGKPNQNTNSYSDNIDF